MEGYGPHPGAEAGSGDGSQRAGMLSPGGAWIPGKKWWFNAGLMMIYWDYR